MIDEPIYLVFRTEIPFKETGKPVYIAHWCHFDKAARERVSACPNYLGFTASFQAAQKLVGGAGHVVTSWNNSFAFAWVLGQLASLPCGIK